MGFAILAGAMLAVIVLGIYGEYRWGDAKLRRFTATASTAIENGYIVYQDSSTKKILPAASYTWDTNIATTQASFHDVFAGVAYERRRADQTDTNEIEIQTAGVFEF